MKFDIDFVEKLAKVITKHGLTEITLDNNDELITIKRENIQGTTPQVIQETKAPEAKPEPKIEEPKVELKKEAKAIKSPMVGSFYMAPAPGAKPFVKVGDMVSTGQVVCIIEAMKLMNEIEAEVSGRITQICVEDGQSVEYGQILMYVE